ncbi:MAG TPA: DUF2249 domain-containing protein [Trueperaceae bacterium]|nr:DUF2249 domain-containing protein [Trueperaceae bacterium]
MTVTSKTTISSSEAAVTDPASALAQLIKLFDKSLRALGDTGKEQAACELAAEGWKLLRTAWPKEGERLNGTLHYLTRTPKKGRPTMADPDLDVRTLAPAQRHQIIFAKYFELEPGACYVLVNDHDPKPLYYQFAAEHAGEFSWEPIEEGPDVWRVRIGKTAKS